MMPDTISCRMICVDSRLGAEQLEESYPGGSAQTRILPFCCPDSFENEEIPDGFEKDMASLPEKYLFYPAQFWTHKNHRRLLGAVAELKPEFPDIRLVLVGSAKNLQMNIPELCKAYGIEENVIVFGFVKGEYMRELFKRARGMVYPSFWGPTNIPPLEAMAANCPYAVSDVFAMREQSGDAALYFNPESQSEIAQAVKTLWCDDRALAELKKAGAEQRRKYQFSAFAGNLKRILLEGASSPAAVK